MCRPATFIITKNQVLWSLKDESHEVIIKENNLKDEHNITFVRVEIVPRDDNYLLPFSQWIYHLDQDLLPDWYNVKEAEKRARKQLPKWRKAKVVVSYDLINCGIRGDRNCDVWH